MHHKIQALLDKYIIPEPNSGCWLWAGATNRMGYGCVGHPEKQKTYLAHRLTYEYLVGDIPDDACVLHRCDNPPCCNPDHLWLGSRADNNSDKVSKGRARHISGAAVNTARLTDAIVLEIMSRLSSGDRQIDIARDFGMGKCIVNHIARGRTWKHLKLKES